MRQIQQNKNGLKQPLRNKDRPRTSTPRRRQTLSSVAVLEGHAVVSLGASAWTGTSTGSCPPRFGPLESDDRRKGGAEPNARHDCRTQAPSPERLKLPWSGRQPWERIWNCILPHRKEVRLLASSLWSDHWGPTLKTATSLLHTLGSLKRLHKVSPNQKRSTPNVH